MEDLFGTCRCHLLGVAGFFDEREGRNYYRVVDLISGLGGEESLQKSPSFVGIG